MVNSSPTRQTAGTEKFKHWREADLKYVKGGLCKNGAETETAPLDQGRIHEMTEVGERPCRLRILQILWQTTGGARRFSLSLQRGEVRLGLLGPTGRQDDCFY